ncbi:MAG: poly(beta-D-mannuronate) O-acetylase, partial [Bacteroidota bacterium]
MLFNSFEFLVFFPLVVMAYFAMPARYRWTLLLAASYLFYAAWKVEYLALIIASTLVDFWAGRQMARRDGPSARRPFLLVSLGLNLGLLGTFKYFNFFSESFRAASAYLNEAVGLPDLFADSLVLEVLLPVGISFYTFQTLSYTIDVYRGKKEAETHLGLFALYVSFFPQLVAGP